MKMAELIGKNIQQLMDTNSVSAVDLAKALSVTRQTLSNYINGQSIIDSEKLVAVSNYFNKPFDYFLESDHKDMDFMFRATNPKDNIDYNTYNCIENLMNNYYEAAKLDHDEQAVYIPEYYYLTVNYNSKNFSISDSSVSYKTFDNKLPEELENTLEMIAYEQRKKLAAEDTLGDGLIRSLEDIGIKILFHSLENKDLFGTSAFNKNKGCFIFINDNEDIPEERKLFSLAHEYAHLILHRECYGNRNINSQYGTIRNIVEVTADSFAGYFLMPRYLIKRYERILTKKPLELSDLIRIKSELKVSLMALVYTLFKYKYISDIQKKRIFDYLYKKGYSKSEPSPTLKLEKNQKYMSIIKSLYMDNKISVSKVSELLNCNIFKTREIVRNWEKDEEEIQITIK